MIKLYNTLTRRKDPLMPVQEGKVGLYACGPTVYDYFHIGNARVFILFDVFRRYLQYRGFNVTYVQNYTDIDDKMINRAAELGITVQELAGRFIQAYEEDAAAIGVQPADHHPKATEYIPQIIRIIEQLLEKEMAYVVDGDVYFRVESFPEYGKLSHQNLEELELGSRVEIDARKKHPMDFVLWKKEKPGEPSWESPWGRGRPGWHIECSAMSMEFLGETIDIHAGGQDLIFPHHENEIAQSEGATGQPFVRYWVHAGYLNINQEKMSKSLGNFRTVRELRQKVDPMVLRFFMLSAHYRNPINFSEEQIQQASKALERLNTAFFNLQDRMKKVDEGEPDEGEQDLMRKLEEAKRRFIEVMDDDFNTAEALAVLFDLARETNTYLNRVEGQKANVIRPILNFFRETNEIFGYMETDESSSLESEIQDLIDQREEARKSKKWTLADGIRDQLREKGIILEDTPQGVRWKIVAEDKREA